ncbi:MAG: VOC family protein [Cellulomonas sp.]|nr:VOC family protein [Cellulomonas sp.]
MDRRLSLTLDAADPRALGAFWAFALGYVEESPPAPYADWPATFEAWGLPPERWNDAYIVVDPEGTGPRLFLQKVPEPKTAKNRLHLDVGVPGITPGQSATHDQVRAHAVRLAEAGARQIEEFDLPEMGFWIVMNDPEGNEFCVL